MRFFLPLSLVALAQASLAADDKAGLAFFESKIRPALVKHCHECHARDSKKIGGKLLLDSRDGVLKGGESGAALVAGKPAESLLIHALKWENDLEMPPKEPLPPQTIADF